ncbi:hypothetical protein HQN83_02810 [Pedobacter sp. LMG 31643]|nr:hypothetical protein [Pedobacter foliorum]NRF37626.1 hypothetical protein [Pedobacter foliorum]
MGNGPIRDHKPLMSYVDNYEQKVRSIDLIRTIFNNAIKERQWIFEPSTKRWFNPEEFLEMYGRYDNIDLKWFEKIEVRDPMEGLEAADMQIESILSRKAILEKRIIEYWKGKSRKA